MMQAYFVRNTSHPSGIVRHCIESATSPASSFMRPITPPRHPDAAKSSLASMQPLVFITRFECEQRCCSFGICVHFQFCCGVKNCPDGLVCDRCHGHADELDIWARRKCPLHQNPGEKGWVPSRPEDFLATDQDRERCKEVLMRSTMGVWDGLKQAAGGAKRIRKVESGCRRVQKRRVDENERSLEWE